MFFKWLHFVKIKRFLFLLGLYDLLAFVYGATHDELPQCGLSGVYKTRQSIIESPNYPNNYPTKTCWDYVIRSPYRCPTKFHIQFLDFHLESSNNCTNDYLAIGLENDGDDMDLLCGQVIGIKKYHTPDGILRLRFFANDSPWTTARGFKLLITRLACERENYLSETLDGGDEDTEQGRAPSLEFEPPKNTLPELFRNMTQTEQHLPHPIAPLFGWNIWPGHLPVPSPPPPPVLGGLYAPPPNQQGLSPNFGNNKPCVEEKGVVNPYVPYQRYPALVYRSNDEQKPISPDQHVGPIWSSGTQTRQREQTLKSDNLAKPVNDAQSRQQFTADVQFGDGVQFNSPFGSQYGAQIAAPFGGAGNPQFGGSPFPAAQFGDAQFSGILPINIPPTGSVPSSPLQQCCTTAFNQKRFYLSSPGFPRTAFTSLLPAQQRDCFFELAKNAQNICRLRIEFKFFDFGQPFRGSGDVRGNINVAISTSRDVCTEDFIEIGGERFCGCRTGYVYTSPWGFDDVKKMRMRMGYSGIPSSGFLLDIYQEECQKIGYVQQQRPSVSLSADGVQLTAGGQNNLSLGAPQTPVSVQSSTPANSLNQQQLPLYQPPSYFTQPSSPPSLSPQNNIALDQIPYRPLQTPNINPFLPPHPSQLWPPTAQPTYAEFSYNQFGPFGSQVPLYRHGKIMNFAAAASTHQPVTVVETNSTRKEYYYFDGDEAFGRLRANDEPNDIDRNGIAPATATETGTVSAVKRDDCTFSTMDALRLTVDSLWITKPTCYAPLRSWFSSAFG